MLKIIFAGTPEFSVPCLQALLESQHQVCAVYTQPDRPSGRGQKTQPGPVKQLAAKYQIPIYQPASLNNNQELQRLSSLNADIMVVIAYGLILPPEILISPRLGCINVHASLLPQWRGASPIQYAILNGDQLSGITVIQMNQGLDTGDILYKEPYQLKPDETAASLHDYLAISGAKVLLSTLKNIENSQLKPQAQDQSLSSYAHKINKSDALIDWSEPATTIERKIRAFNPWPIAYTLMDNRQRLRIWKAREVNLSTQETCGKIVSVDKIGINVVTGKGVVQLLEIQAAGGRQMLVRDFVNAHDIKPGSKLG